MYCPNCGYLNRPGAKYCGACRVALSAGLAPLRDPLDVGELMDNGRYRIVRSLGKGGMGAVWLAENLQAFNRQVVIKEMLDYFDRDDPEQVKRAKQRFEDEARTLAALKHPAVPDIYGYFSQQGRNYLVMEFIAGENLETGITHRNGQDDLIPALPYTPEQIVLFGIQLCDLLVYLAGRADPDTGTPQPVIHHDIKPANIIRDPETENVWLVDFGTAKTRFRDIPPHETAAGTNQPSVEKESVYGTVGYAPPEQYQGASEPKSDVYALAATLYHLLTDDDPRDHPFQFEALGDLPSNLRLALKGALETDPTLRTEASDFKAALLTCMPDQPTVEIQPLVFPDGNQAKRLSDIPALAQEYWDYTRDILYEGDLEHWLRRSMHNPVVADTARRITTGTLDDPDAGLDSFLRELNPDLPTGKLQLKTRSLNLGSLVRNRATTASVVLRNQGPGFSHGTITSSAGWLYEQDGRFSVKPGGTDELTIEVETASLTPGTSYAETLTLAPADGSKPLKLDVSLSIAAAMISSTPSNLTFDLSQEDQPGPAELTLTNTGGGPVKCRVSRDQPWLLLQPKDIALPPGQHATIKVSIRADRLPPQPKLQAQLTITPDHGSELTVPIMVRKRRPSRARRWVLIALIPIALVAIAFVLMWARGGDPFRASLKTEPTVPARTAEQLDSIMVTVDGFDMDRYEVTNLQYARYDSTHIFDDDQALLPVAQVTWEEARAYCQWAGKSLPEEKEWERAAAGPESWTYPWGNESDHTRVNSQNNRDTQDLLPIDTLPLGATPGGIHHLLGNVSEWVVGTQEHPRTHRGGSWQDIGLTNSISFWENADFKSETVGFRCVIRQGETF